MLSEICPKLPCLDRSSAVALVGKKMGDAPRCLVALSACDWLDDISARIMMVEVETRLHEPHLLHFTVVPSRGEIKTPICLYCPAPSFINRQCSLVGLSCTKPNICDSIGCCQKYQMRQVEMEERRRNASTVLSCSIAGCDSMVLLLPDDFCRPARPDCLDRIFINRVRSPDQYSPVVQSAAVPHIFTSPARPPGFSCFSKETRRSFEVI